MLKKTLAALTMTGAFSVVLPVASAFAQPVCHTFDSGDLCVTVGDGGLVCFSFYLYRDGELVNTGDICSPV